MLKALFDNLDRRRPGLVGEWLMDNTNLIVSDHQHSRADAVRNRALLLETAQRLFAEQGVEAVCMSAIAEAAGVGKGTLYRHFQNKSELCQALLDQDQRALQERTFEQLRGDLPVREQLHGFVAEILQFVDRNDDLLHVETSAASCLQHPAHWWWRQTIRGLLGQIPAVSDLEFLADQLYALIDPHVIHFLRRVRGYSLDQVMTGTRAALDRLLS